MPGQLDIHCSFEIQALAGCGEREQNSNLGDGRRNVSGRGAASAAHLRREPKSAGSPAESIGVESLPAIYGDFVEIHVAPGCAAAVAIDLEVGDESWAPT